MNLILLFLNYYVQKEEKERGNNKNQMCEMWECFLLE
jgi:hypothetical protein